MGAAARTTTALYCACAAAWSLAAHARARGRAADAACRARLNVEGGAREADRDAVDTENRERLSR